MQYKKQTINLALCIFLSTLPIIIFIWAQWFENRYFDTFSGVLTYASIDHFFSVRPMFILDMPYLLIPLFSGLALWFCLKVRKAIIDQKSALNYIVLVLIVLNFVSLFYFLRLGYTLL
jgi:hypothetical protein